MRHNKRNKYFKIACSWILIFSMCFLSLNTVNVSAEDTTAFESEPSTDQFTSENEEIEQVATEDTDKSEESTEQIIDNDGGTEQPEELNVPESISVQSLDEALQISVANGDEQTTDRVEYVDANGKAIDGAPTTIELGNIEDHKELTISGSGKNYEFKSARVKGKDCVYIGKYENTVYYSTDGKIAIKLDAGQKLTMTYQEYYNITIKEVIPENGVAGTITHDGKTLDTSSVVRVDAGNDWEFTVKPALANKIRYKITSVVSEKDTIITKGSGDEYGATYMAQFQKDDVVTITYSSEGVFRVNVKETDNDGVTCINTDKTHYSRGYINDFTFTESDVNTYNVITLPVFHTVRNKRIIALQVNGQTLKVSNSVSEVPYEKGNPVTVRYGVDKDNIFDIQINITKQYKSHLDNEKGCSYEYQLTITKEKGEWRDFNFVPTYSDTEHQVLNLKLLSTVNGTVQRSEAGMEVAVWDSDTQTLVEAHDKDTYNMDTTYLTTRKQVKFFFAKAKPGYVIDVEASGVTQTCGDTNVSDAFGSAATIDKLTADYKGEIKSTNFDNNWEPAKKAALAQGYTAFIVSSGESGYYNEGIGEWKIYSAQFVASANEYYVMYGKGELPDGATVSDMPESDMMSRNTKSYSNPYPDEPAFGPRNFEETFNVGEKTSEPKCAGYKFIGWKLVDSNGNGGNIYQNNTEFTIDSSNVAYGNVKFVDTKSYAHSNTYRFVAQWQKIGTQSVKVNHYLKAPDGKEKLGKTTEGTITFAEDKETVTAFANPEPAGTFSGYIFDKDDSRNTLETTVTNDASTGTIELNLYYKPTVLTVSKIVSGYNLEPDKTFSFTIQANAPDGTDTNATTLSSDQVYIKKGDGTEENLAFTNNQATFTLKKDESVDISCLPTGWTYTVTETEPGTNFKASYSINGGTVIDGAEALFTMATTGSEAIQFINTSTIAPPVTGRDIRNSSWIMMLIVALLIGMSGVVFFRKVKRKYR